MYSELHDLIMSMHNFVHTTLSYYTNLFIYIICLNIH